MKIIMATCLSSLIALSAHAQMTPEDCGHLSNASKGLMKLHQEGVSYEQLQSQMKTINNPTQQQLFMNILNDAFKLPVVQDQAQKEQLIQDFSQKYAKNCAGK